METSIPPSIMNQITNIDGELQQLAMSVQSGSPDAMKEYQNISAELESLQMQAQKDGVPKNLLNQLAEVSKDLSSAVKGGQFTSGAAKDISDASDILAKILG